MTKSPGRVWRLMAFTESSTLVIMLFAVRMFDFLCFRRSLKQQYHFVQCVV